MELLTYTYASTEALEQYIHSNNIQNSNKTFIQFFSSNASREKVLSIKKELSSMLPNVTLIGTSTSGIVSGGEIYDDKIVLSFSLFEKSTSKDISYSDTNVDTILQDFEQHINEDTKLLIAFANTLKFDSSELLKKIAQKYPHIILAGGNSGDDFRFEECLAFSSKSDDSDIVFAVIDSKQLKITTDYLFNWETIGRSMVVTKSEGPKVYELDGKKIVDVYEYYLGKHVVNNLIVHGIEFPLVFKANGVNVARALISCDMDEKSMIFAGDIPQGQEVKFGYANIEYIEEENQEQLINKHKFQNEAVYVYTCSGRRQMLGKFLDKEIKTLSYIGNAVGFVTYGEFFHDNATCNNNLLNITTTYLCLNEEVHESKKVLIDEYSPNLSKSEVRFRALTTLLKKTSKELDNNLYYLEQFKETVNSAAILSITDEKGLITYANKNFQEISGYSVDELLGKSHNIIRHEDMDSAVFKEMWEAIQDGKMWKGLVKNKRKNGSNYYVVSEIAPIFNKEGSLKEYIGIRTDVTELEEYKAVLEQKLNVSRSNLQENINYIRQFEEAINLATAVIKTDTDSTIKFVNEKFISLSGFSEEELLGKRCRDLRDEKDKKAGKCEKILKQLKENKVVFETMTNVSKSGELFYTNTLFYPIKNTAEEIVEFVQIMFDVTDIYELNKEIEETQKEVVEKMGAIGETRSKETGDHVKRVAEYSYLLAQLYGLSEEEALLLKQASPMHDIGKVGIPDSILNKPGKLTKEEFEVMKEHAKIGYEMLKHSNRDILKASATVAYTHHEKWDGSGYPLAKSGEDIHIYGRITAIADVFDALGHDRVYKKAWELDAILDFFKEQKGKHFEPKLIDLFLENLDKFLEVWQKYKE